MKAFCLYYWRSLRYFELKVVSSWKEQVFWPLSLNLCCMYFIQCDFIIKTIGLMKSQLRSWFLIIFARICLIGLFQRRCALVSYCDLSVDDRLHRLRFDVIAVLEWKKWCSMVVSKLQLFLYTFEVIIVGCTLVLLFLVGNFRNNDVRGFGQICD